MNVARRVGTCWIKDGIDGRRTEAQGFGSRLDGLAEFAWTEDHGDAGVVAKDLVDNASSDSVAALVLASHGSPSGFAAWDGFVSTHDAVDFGKSDLEVFASQAGALLEHTPENSVGRWIPAFERLHHMFGFHTTPYSGGGQDPRGALFAGYAAWLHYTLGGVFDMPVREAWIEANELVEGPDVEWAYLRVSGAESNTYHERLRAEELAGPGSDRVFHTARGSC
jgi:Family of unknown function (DUF6345)